VSYEELPEPDPLEERIARLETKVAELRQSIQKDSVVLLLNILHQAMRDIAAGKYGIDSTATPANDGDKWSTVKSRLAPRLREMRRPAPSAAQNEADAGSQLRLRWTIPTAPRCHRSAASARAFSRTTTVNYHESCDERESRTARKSQRNQNAGADRERLGPISRSQPTEATRPKSVIGWKATYIPVPTEGAWGN